jgi:hypothetical protein
MIEFLDQNLNNVLSWLAISSLLIFFFSILAINFIIKMIPADYFESATRELSPFKTNNPILWFVLIIIKNTLGYMLIIGGLLMLILPGQGLLTILIGLILSDYPGKYKLEKKLISLRPINRYINWVRKKSNLEPVKLV